MEEEVKKAHADVGVGTELSQLGEPFREEILFPIDATDTVFPRSFKSGIYCPPKYTLQAVPTPTRRRHRADRVGCCY